MTPQTNKNSNGGLLRFLYPSIAIVIGVVILLVFLKTTRFLSTALNKPFSITQEQVQSEVLRVDTPGANVVGKRLGFNINTEESQNTDTANDEDTTTTDDTTATENQNTTDQNNPGDTTTDNTNTNASAPTTATEDKKLLRINILNSTKTGGLAGKLKDQLTAAGFTNITTDNTTPTQATTEIKTNATAIANYPTSLSELKNIVSTDYPTPTTTTIDPPNQTNDVIIIIGTK